MVYVDQIQEYPPERIKPGARGCGTRWCHLTADTREELHAFAERLGLKRVWFQEHRFLFHYDLTPGMRRKAVELGAVEVDAATRSQAMWEHGMRERQETSE